MGTTQYLYQKYITALDDSVKLLFQCPRCVVGTCTYYSKYTIIMAMVFTVHGTSKLLLLLFSHPVVSDSLQPHVHVHCIGDTNNLSLLFSLGGRSIFYIQRNKSNRVLFFTPFLQVQYIIFIQQGRNDIHSTLSMVKCCVYLIWKSFKYVVQ